MNLEIVNDGVVGKTVIKVIGCGGGGGNAVTRMINEGVAGVDFIAANTDLQALEASSAQVKIPLGRKITGGLGAGGKPEVGEKAAEEDREEIQNALRGTEMVFVTAGMGGGTGTGSAPVIARIARELGCLTVAVVTRPFRHEGKKKMALADDGIKQLRNHVDTLIVIPNENLLNLVDQNITLREGLLKADEVLKMGVQGISDLITQRGEINIDFSDVRTVMEGQGDALMGIGEARGEERASKAANMAIKNPLLDDVDIEGARGLLVNITSGSDLSLGEFNEIMEVIAERVDEDATIISGHATDEDLGDRVLVTVIATGFRDGHNSEKTKSTVRVQEKENQDILPFSAWKGVSEGRGLSTSTPPAQSEMTKNPVQIPLSPENPDLLIPTALREKRFGYGK